jgi:hypothetical protein
LGKRLLVVLVVASTWEAGAVWWAVESHWLYAPWVPIISPFLAICAVIALVILDATGRAYCDAASVRAGSLSPLLSSRARPPT